MTNPFRNIVNKNVDPDTIDIDVYQRAATKALLARAWKIAADFDAHKFRPVEAAVRPDGSMYTFDGQTRTLAAQILKAQGKLSTIPCRVHKGLTFQSEAELLVKIARSTQPISQVDAFVASVYAGDRVSVEVDKTVSAAGFKVENKTGKKSIRAASTIRTIYNQHGADNLKSTLVLIKDVWFGDDLALEGRFLTSVSRFIQDFGSKVMDETVKKNLRSNPPAFYINRADVKDMVGGREKTTERIAVQIQKASGLRAHDRVRKPKKANAGAKKMVKAAKATV